MLNKISKNDKKSKNTMAKLKPTLEALNTKIGAGKNQIRNLENWSEEHFRNKQQQQHEKNKQQTQFCV